MPKMLDLVHGPKAIYGGEKLKCPFCRTEMLIETVEVQSEIHNYFYMSAVEPYQRHWIEVENRNLYNFVCPAWGSKMISPVAGDFFEKIRIENHS